MREFELHSIHFKPEPSMRRLTERAEHDTAVIKLKEDMFFELHRDLHDDDEATYK